MFFKVPHSRGRRACSRLVAYILTLLLLVYNRTVALNKKFIFFRKRPLNRSSGGPSGLAGGGPWLWAWPTEFC